MATGHEEALENIVEETETKEEAAKGPVYGVPLEDIKRNIYQLATPDVYNGIKDLRNEAAKRELNEEEERRLRSYDSAFSQISNVQAAYIRDEQARVSLIKAKQALEQIKKYETGQ